MKLLNLFTVCEKKLQADATLCGRSMVEMLGVLAIIGVLSVGAIAGYSKAMWKHKVNKSIVQITSILTGVQRVYINEKGGELGKYENLTPSMLKKLKIINENENIFPCEELEGYRGSSLGRGSDDKSMCIQIGVGDGLAIGGNGANYIGGFALELINLPKEACMELASKDWPAFSGFSGIVVNSAFDGDAGHPWDCMLNPEAPSYIEKDEGRVGKCAKGGALTMSEVAVGCNCTKENNCEIILGFE